jgi:TolA-binding protein
LQVTLGTAKREVAEKFEPGQTLALDWPSVAPPSGPKLPPGPTAAELEAQAWDRARNSSNPSDIEKFLTDYPGSGHVPEAQSKLDDLAWAKTDQKDAQSLRAYLNRFPKGAHSRDGSTQIAELAWNGTDKKDAQALRAFVGQYPDSPRKSEAQNIIDQLEKQRVDAEQRNKEDRLKQEQARAQGQGLQSTVDRFNAAFNSRQIDKDFKEVWPSAPSRYTDYMKGDKSNSIVMNLSQCGEGAPNGNAATIPCELTQTSTIKGQTRPPTRVGVNVILQKRDTRWIIVNLTPR